MSIVKLHQHCYFIEAEDELHLLSTIKFILGGGGVQGQGKGQRLMSIFAGIDYIWLATCQSKIYEK